MNNKALELVEKFDKIQTLQIMAQSYKACSDDLFEESNKQVKVFLNAFMAYHDICIGMVVFADAELLGTINSSGWATSVHNGTPLFVKRVSLHHDDSISFSLGINGVTLCVDVGFTHFKNLRRA